MEVALNWALGRGWKKFEEYKKKSLDCLEPIVRNMDVKSTADEGPESTGEYIYGNQRKGDPYYIVEESLVGLCITVM